MMYKLNIETSETLNCDGIIEWCIATENVFKNLKFQEGRSLPFAMKRINIYIRLVNKPPLLFSSFHPPPSQTLSSQFERLLPPLTSLLGPGIMINHNDIEVVSQHLNFMYT